ncbi:hypothetical protein DFJ74DRAFT_658901 [Hyaloraphidium curvatum]|nr:hypothetical protein DFJ74DRAFT_658901 [Hyaloraphidium curvatum]
MLAQSPTAVATSPSTTPGSPPRKRAAEPMDPDVKRRNSSSSESSCETAYAEACPGSPASDTTSARSLTPTEPESASDTEQNSDDCSAKATAAFQRLAFAYETLRDPGARRRYDLHGEDAFSGDVDEGYGEFWWWGDWVGRNGEEEEVAEADEGPSVAEEIFGSAVKQLYEDFFSTSFDQIMAAIDIVHRLNPQLDFSREKLTRFLLRLRDLAALSSQSLASGLFASVHREVYRLSELRDEWASLSWWDIGGQLRVGIEMGRALVKIYGRVAAEARMRGIDVEEAIDAAAVVGLAVSPRGRLRMGNGMPIVVT